MTDRDAVVLVSGGMDSAVTLAAARAEGRRCAALTIDYGQRHRCEIAAALRVAHALGAHRVVRVGLDLSSVGGSALTDTTIPVPKHAHLTPSPPSIPVTYVPARNIVFLSLAVGLAETIGASEVWIGVNAVDFSGYPDCRQPFIHAFEHAAALGTRAGDVGSPVRIRTPIIHLAKHDIVRLGVSLGVDFSITHSCYDPVTAADHDALACGACDACLIRRRGFADAHVPDPTRYAHAHAAAGSTP